MTELRRAADESERSFLDPVIRFCLENRLIVVLALAFLLFWGLRVAPLDWEIGGLPRDPVATDAIPDIGENQQIVFTDWPGRSPQNVEDQITYPLTVALMGIPGVKTIRSASMFGFSSIYVIFNEGVDFYWSRSRVLEKLNSLPGGMLPPGVEPMLGPDATALGQVFWYTLEGRDEEGNPAGGWDLGELRSLQDWHVRYSLLSAEGVSEVASVGGFVQEYQVDVDPDAMRAHGVMLEDVFRAVRNANIDVGARSIELNRVEYFIRGLGFIRSIEDIENSLVKVTENVPILIRHVARVSAGPGLRRGALDKDGAESVGGVVVMRYGQNPLTAINNTKKRIAEIAAGLPEKVLIDWRQTTRAEVERFAASHGFDAFASALDQRTSPSRPNSAPSPPGASPALIASINHSGEHPTGGQTPAEASFSTSFTLNQPGWLAWLKQTGPDGRPSWISYSRVEIVPFYDRTGLIYETLGTLNTAILQQILITVIVVLIMVRHLASSAIISGMLPMAVLMTFIAMKQFGVDANIVALSGIAIAIGTVVDMGIVICENILRRLQEARDQGSAEPSVEIVFRATREVGSAVLTAVATTIVGFLPVFVMEGAEGKLFKPLAFTKTFALLASILLALTVIPPFAHALFSGRIRTERFRQLLYGGLAVGGLILLVIAPWWLGAIVLSAALFKLAQPRLPERWTEAAHDSGTWILVALLAVLLALNWLPLGPARGFLLNFLFLALVIGGVLGTFGLFRSSYPRVLAWILNHKGTFLLLPAGVVLLGGMIWLGVPRLFGWLPASIFSSRPVTALAHAFPGLGKEFMPSLDEGSFLYMPSTMPHASIGEALDVLQKLDLAISSVPEVELAAGKLGRAESPLDPADISMFETVVHYHPEFLADANGRRLRFQFLPNENDFFRSADGQPVAAEDGEPYMVRGRFARENGGQLIPDSRGVPFRIWRPALDPTLNRGRAAWAGVRTPGDIWEQIVARAAIPGTTSAPRLQPIAARIVMLQSGMRAPMGVKIKGPTLAAIEEAGLQIERLLKQVPQVEPSAVVADRVVGKPYLEIEFDRQALARYGLTIRDAQDVVEIALGGEPITMTVEGRERYPVRVRYQREQRDQIETLERVLLASSEGAQIPLGQVASIHYVRGPMVIKSEDTFLTSYVTFDMKPGHAEVDVVEQAQSFLQQSLARGELLLPPGVSFTFAGSYENQLRAAQKLMLVVPLALFIIFFILYLHFRSSLTALLVFSGIFVAWAGGFLMVWLYGQSWFLNFSFLGTDLRQLFQIQPINLSVAVWVGFLALFGIAVDDGVLMATILRQRFAEAKLDTIQAIRTATIEAAQQRIRPALMTSATTLLALLPVLTSTGRGADIMIPMAIPTFGGMVLAMLTVFMVPVLYCLTAEWRLRFTGLHEGSASPQA
jgi:copper/silver efflux system protein